MNPELKREQHEEDTSPARNPAQEKISLFTEQFLKAEQAVKAKHDMWAIMDMFDRSEQWKNVDLPPWVPKPVHNMIKYVRVLKRSNLASSIPSANFIPLNKDHEKQVRRLQKAYKHVWDTEKVAYMVRRSIDRSLLQGTAIACVYSDDNFIDGEYYGHDDPKNRMYQGAIRVKRFPNANFFPDPDATSIETCRWIETTEVTTRAAIQNNPKFIKHVGKEKLLGLSNTASSQSDDSTGQIYDREVNPFNSDPPDRKDQRMILHTRWEYAYDEKGKRKLNVYYYVPGNDFFLYEIKDVKPSIFPFVALYDEEEENDFWGTALTWDILEKQKLINKTEQTASIIATMYQNPQKIVARESGINGQQMAREGTMPGKVWTTNIDPSRSVHTLQPADIPRGVFDIKDRQISDIKDYVGINEAYVGESVGSLTTSTGVNSLIDRATIRDKDKMKQIDNFVDDLSNLIVMFILEKWTDKRPLVNIGSAGKVTHEEWEPFEKGEVDNIKWLIRSDVYASAPATQALKKQQADQLLQMQGQFNLDPPLITIEEWLNYQDLEYMDEIRERMEKDRKKKERREAADFASMAMQLADMANQMRMQGMPAEQVNQAITEEAKKILDGKAKNDNLVGFGGASAPSGRPRDAEAENTREGGMDSQAQANMNRG